MVRREERWDSRDWRWVVREVFAERRVVRWDWVDGWEGWRVEREERRVGFERMVDRSVVLCRWVERRVVSLNVYLRVGLNGKMGEVTIYL